MGSIPFSKFHSLGNDFILVEGEGSEEMRRLAPAICDRHLGVGADGLLILDPSRPSVRRIYNADGSEAEISGNGVRCAAAYWVARRNRETPLRVETPAGEKFLELVEAAPPTYRFRANMGKPEWVEARRTLDVEGRTYTATLSNLGNPHCTLLLDAVTEEFVQRFGPKFEGHPQFPFRTNVEFVQVRSRSEVAAAFWERGVGRTLSSGTGSCAAAVAAIVQGLTDRSVHVCSALGSQQVEWLPSGDIYLTGPATEICRGEFEDEAVGAV